MLSESEFIDLCYKYRTGELTRDEYRKLQAGLEVSEENRKLFSDYVKLYKTELRLEASHTASASEAWKIIERRCRRYQLRRRAYWGVAAACLLAVVMTATFYFYPGADGIPAPGGKTETLADIFPDLPQNKVVLTLSSGRQLLLDKDSLQAIADEDRIVASGTNNSLDYQASVSQPTGAVAYNKISVPAGSVFSLTLSDGSKIVLNSSTTFRYPVSFQGERIVELDGEAYFHVAHSGVPFIVKTKGKEVCVLGTQFNLSAYEDKNMVTTLVTGKVEVKSGTQRKQLIPGQQATVCSGDDAIAVKEVDTDIYTSWMTGEYDFRSTPLHTILSQFELWYDVKVEYKDVRIRNIRFDGTVFRNRPLGFSLEIIQAVSDVEFVKNDRTVVVSLKDE